MTSHLTNHLSRVPTADTALTVLSASACRASPRFHFRKYIVTQPAHRYHLLSFFSRNVQMCILYVAGLELPVSDFVPSGMLEHRLTRTIVILHGKLRVTVNSCEFIM